jgi:hypothetical protein
MEVFLERLLLELLVIAAQIAILRLVTWVRSRMAASGATPVVAA